MKTYDVEDLDMTPKEREEFLKGARKFAQIEHDPEDDNTVPPVDIVE